jgi:hypothetical protein
MPSLHEQPGRQYLKLSLLLQMGFKLSHVASHMWHARITSSSLQMGGGNIIIDSTAG